MALLAAIQEAIIDQIGLIVAAAIPAAVSIYLASKSIGKKLSKIHTAVGIDKVVSYDSDAPDSNLYEMINDLGSEVRQLNYRLNHHIEEYNGPDGQYERLLRDLEPIKRFVLGYAGSKLEDAAAVNRLVVRVHDISDRLDALEQAQGISSPRLWDEE